MADAGRRRFSLYRLLPLGLLLVAGVIFVLCGGRRYLAFTTLAEHRDALGTLAAHGGADKDVAKSFDRRLQRYIKRMNLSRHQPSDGKKQ